MAEYADREQSFDSSMGSYVGSFMSSVSRADMQRQRDWVGAVVDLSTPDKDGKIPEIVLHSGISDQGKAVSGADISFPIVLALLGQQFAADKATMAMTMNVEASSLDESNAQEQESGSGSAHFGIGGLNASVKISVSASETQDHKRTSDYRATTTCSLEMTRVPTPEPIQRVLQAFMKTVDVECKLAEAIINANGQKKAQELGLLPKPDNQPTPQPSGGGN